MCRWCTRATMAKAWLARAALPSAVVQRSSRTPKASSTLLLLAFGRRSMSKGTTPTSATLILFFLGMQMVSKAFKPALMALGSKSSHNNLARALSTPGIAPMLLLCDNFVSDAIPARTVTAFTLASKLPLHKNQARVATELYVKSCFRRCLFAPTSRSTRMASASSQASKLKETLYYFFFFLSCFFSIGIGYLHRNSKAPPITEVSMEMASDYWMHLRFLSLSRATDLMFFRLGSGSTELCTSQSILAIVSTATGTKGVARSHTRALDEPLPPCASHQFWMRHRNVSFGTSSKEANVCIVAGHVWFPASSHGSMMLCS